MTQENYIVDGQLPLELDFKALKAEAFAYIQEHSGMEWTNLNSSDPGVTILEQLLYAFTELGYCGNFSMKDILTQKSGDLTVDNQFYLPQNILTTSPITIDDYVKYVIDQIANVKNVLIQPTTLAFPFVSGVYEVYLLLNPNSYENATTDDDITTINQANETETFYLLNSCRNVSELFLKPQTLIGKEYIISGKLAIASGYDLHTILPEIMQSITDYIFPDVVQTGYDRLKVEGEKTNDIFNGPTLDNGWISTGSIQPKKDTIQAFEITKLIQGVEGVQSISGVSFTHNSTTSDTATCENNEILKFNFSESFVTNTNFQISTEGKDLNASLNTSLLDELANMQQASSQINEVASVQMAPKLPTGKYRDITSYYSIQHTFPEAYAVGLNATNDNTPAYQMAQSRQLKGYLSLFDQMLSNQFAQLANIDKLFSFKNSITGNPADLENYYNTKTAEEKANPKYPVPFEVFSPTYFYQSLYQSVPNVEPLLRNNGIFKFGPVSESDATLSHKNWVSYQEDPYNSYMYGLLIINEDDTINLQRRDDLLDHLLARHGESPRVMNTLVYGTVYSGDILKDRVIIKSLYLQNLTALSYNRVKAYHNIGATKLNAFIIEITSELIDQLSKINSTETLADLQLKLADVLDENQQKIETAKAKYNTKKELHKILTQTYKKNGVFDTNRINEEGKITSQDSLDYITLSLKLGMLLTIKPFYVNFVQGVLELDPETTTQDELTLSYQQSEMVLWLLTQRKGMIAIETNLLLQSGSFQIYIKEHTISNTYYRLDTMLDYVDFIMLSTKLNTMDSQDIQTYLTNINAAYTLTKIESSTIKDTTFTAIENTGYSWTASVNWNNENTMYITDPFLEDTLLWIFPNYIPEIIASDWQHRLSYFMDSQLPIQITANPMYASKDDLKTLIPQYVDWYNANIYNAKTQNIDSTALTTSAATLITTLVQISKNTLPTNA
ncbi:hypothetical protein [uncultured Kordia sp.]|uniref:hypothetical protein n=1 Tax=uncultured Kordia sp. TaxID=507699 RepID=UPI00261DA561|nr:hypothetical protein [uncultured Kordia sp.]